MIQFVLPTALLSAGAILVPVLLHLWRPPARTVRLGSLRFLQTVPGRRLRDLRWRDRLILLLRIALLLALAALLAGPFWSDRREGPQRWALLAPGAVLDGPALQSWREFLAEGYQPRLLVPGFPSADPSAPSPSKNLIDAWSLLREADARVPAGSKFTVFAPPRAALLRGQRPTLARSEVRWVAASTRDEGLSAWLEPGAIVASGRGFRATIGASDANATRFSVFEVSGTANAGTISDPATRAELKFRQSGEQIAVQLTGSKANDWTPVAILRPIRVAIVHGPQRAEDARLVAAAVHAVEEISGRQIRVEIREESASTVLPESDWVFRLGATPLTPSMSHVLAEDRVNVVTDAARDENEELQDSWFVSADDAIGVNGHRLWRRVKAGADAGALIWSDSWGNPLLTFVREGRAERWRFFSRFHPMANDLVSDGAFPAWMRALLLGQDGEANLRSHDRRLVSDAQIRPDHSSVAQTGSSLAPAAGRSVDLQAWNWALITLLLVLERTLSLLLPTQRGGESEPASTVKSRQMAEVGR